MGRSGAGETPFYLGIKIGMLLVMVISASSAAASVLALPGVRPVIAIAATLYFSYLAYRIAAPPPLSDTRADRQPSPLNAGILNSLDNPKAQASTNALFSGFILIGGAAQDESDFDLLADCAAAHLGCVSFDPTEAIIAIGARNEERRLAIVMPKSEGTRYAIRFAELRRDPRRGRDFTTRGLAKTWLAITLPTTSLAPD